MRLPEAVPVVEEANSDVLRVLGFVPWVEPRNHQLECAHTNVLKCLFCKRNACLLVQIWKAQFKVTQSNTPAFVTKPIQESTGGSSQGAYPSEWKPDH